MKLVYLVLSLGFALTASADTKSIPDYGRPGIPPVGSRQKALEKCQKEHPGMNCLDIISAENVRPADAGRPGLPADGKRQRVIDECLKTNSLTHCLEKLSVKKDAPAPRVQTATLQPTEESANSSN